MGFFFGFLQTIAGIWKFWPESGNLSVGSGFSGFRGGKPKPIRQNRFMMVKTRHRPAGAVGSAIFGSDPVGSSSGSGYRINLDSPDCSNFKSAFTGSFLKNSLILAL